MVRLLSRSIASTSIDRYFSGVATAYLVHLGYDTNKLKLWDQV